MGDSAQQRASHCDEYQRVEAMVVVAYEPARTGHPAKRAFEHLTARLHFKACVGIGSASDLPHKLAAYGLVERHDPTIGAVGKQGLQLRSAPSHSIEDPLHVGAVGGGAIPAPSGVRRLDRVSIEASAGRAGVTLKQLASEDRRCVANGLERHAVHEMPKPPIECHSRAGFDWRHPPFAIVAGRMGDRIEHLGQICTDMTTPVGVRGQLWLNVFQLIIGPVYWMPLGPACDIGHAPQCCRVWIAVHSSRARCDLFQRSLIQDEDRPNIVGTCVYCWASVQKWEDLWRLLSSLVPRA
jgi:hypothetical protein